LLKFCVLACFFLFCVLNSFLAVTRIPHRQSGYYVLPLHSVKKLLILLVIYCLTVLFLNTLYGVILYLLF
jgi:hypothetical protein